MGVFYIGDREGSGGVFRRLCVGMILGWDFYWFRVGRGCDVFLWGLLLHNIPSPFHSVMDIFFVDLKVCHIRFYAL